MNVTTEIVIVAKIHANPADTIVMAVRHAQHANHARVVKNNAIGSVGPHRVAEIVKLIVMGLLNGLAGVVVVIPRMN